jgi:hypothetical protein
MIIFILIIFFFFPVKLARCPRSLERVAGRVRVRVVNGGEGAQDEGLEHGDGTADGASGSGSAVGADVVAWGVDVGVSWM